MRIAQIVSYSDQVPPAYQNGLEFVVSWITEELVRRGHEVTLFAPEGSHTKAKLVSVIPHEALHEGKYIWNETMRSAWNTTYAASLADSFDIIHTHTGTIALNLPFISTPIVYTLHHQFKDDFWTEGLEKKKGPSQAFIFNQLSKIQYVAVSKKQASDFSKAKKLYFKKHEVIHNGIPVHQFEFNAQPKDYLLYIGYINKNKGADIAVKVARKLNMKLILAGNNYGEEKFFNAHIKPYLSKKIKYVGPVNFAQKNELYKNALAKLAPLYWDEPFGLTFAESLACGTPVIAFDKGAAAEIITHGKTGFIVRTEAEMCKAVKRIESINRADCRKSAEERFSIERMVDDYEALYKKTLHVTRT